MFSAPVIGDAVDWRARAERAEGRAAELEVRVAELSEQVAVLSRMLFGRSSEKTNPIPDRGAEAGEPEGPDTRGPRDRDGAGRKRGQRPGGKGRGRRDYSHLDTRGRSMMSPPSGGCAPVAGWSSNSWVLRPVSRSRGCSISGHVVCRNLVSVSSGNRRPTCSAHSAIVTGGPPGVMAGAIAGARYFLIVLRSTPRLVCDLALRARSHTRG